MAGEPICLVYIVDVSGSTDGNDGIDANGDGPVNAADNFNGPSGDTEFGEILDGEIAGVLALHASIGNPSNVYVGMVAFASNAANVDVGSQGGFQYFVTPPQLDNNAANGVDIGEALRTFRSGEGGGGSVGQFTSISSGVLGNNTDYDDPLTEMNEAFANCPESGTNIAFFLSDGQSNDTRCVDGGCAAQLAAANAAGTIINTVGVGAEADGTDLSFIAAQTGGTYLAVTDPSDLTTSLPGITPAGVDRCEVDGVEVPVDALGNFEATAVPGPRAAHRDGDLLRRRSRHDRGVGRSHADLRPGLSDDRRRARLLAAGLQRTALQRRECLHPDRYLSGGEYTEQPGRLQRSGECLSAFCNPATGCDQSNDPNGATCNDGDVCINGETCTNGVCGGGGPAPNHTPCDADGDACTVEDACESGVCSPGPTTNCPSDSCLACNPNNGVCDTPLADGEECELGGTTRARSTSAWAASAPRLPSFSTRGVR